MITQPAAAVGTVIRGDRCILPMSTDEPSFHDSGYTTFGPDDDRTLSEAVLGAIEDQQGIDLVNAQFTLYDVINPDALERLFRFNQNAATTVSFVIDETHVSLRDAGDEIEIRADDV